MKLYEIVSLQSKTETFLLKWTEGSTRASLHLTQSVKDDLKKTVTETTYKVYRGWKFADPDDLAKIFGVTHKNLKPGARVKVKLDTLHSWTKDKSEAVKFSNPRFDSFEKEWFDDEAIEDLGYERGDLLGLGVLVEATIPAKQVLSDLENVDPDILQYNDEESEIITLAGDYDVTVIAVDVHYFNDSESDDETDEMDEDDWEQHNRESEEENDHMAKTQDALPQLLKKHNLTETESDLKKLLDLEKRQDVGIAVIMKYGFKFPGIKKYAVEHESEYQKSYKHFTINAISKLHSSLPR